MRGRRGLIGIAGALALGFAVLQPLPASAGDEKKDDKKSVEATPAPAHPGTKRLVLVQIHDVTDDTDGPSLAQR